MSLAGTLATAVNAWLSAKPKRNLSMLSRMSGVSYSTLRRLVSGETSVSQENAIEIAARVMDDETFRTLIATHWPSLSRYLLNVNYKFASEDDGGDLQHFLGFRDFSRIIVYASRPAGLNFNEVGKKFGESAMAHFETLVDAGILKPINAIGRVGFRDEIGNISFALARKVLSDLADAFPRCAEDHPKCQIPETAWLAWENLNPDAVRTCNAIMAKAIDDCFTVIKDEKSRGEVLVFMGSLLNVIDGQGKF